MSSSRSSKAIYVDREQGLVIPEGTPPVIEQLARELYKRWDLGRTNDIPGVSRATFVVASPLPLAVGNTPSWAEIAQMRIGAGAEATVQRFILEGGTPYLAAAYGLRQLNRALTAELNTDEMMEAVAWAGCCLGVAALAEGLTQAQSKVAQDRWFELNQIRNEIRARYEQERKKGAPKAVFIRRVKDEVLARAKEHKYNLRESSVEARIRKWLSGL